MKTRILGSVGHLGKNLSGDVKVVQALFNVYNRQNNLPAMAIDGRFSEQLKEQISAFQNDYMRTCLKTHLIMQNNPTHRALQRILDDLVQVQAHPRPSFGQLTWDAEGTEGGFYHSRRLHVPSESSGLTIGRGYDCRKKTAGVIASDLVAAGIDGKSAVLISGAAGLFGKTATQFIIDNDLLDFEIDHVQQLKLFELVYKVIEADVIRISTGKDTVKAYGSIDWAKLNSTIKDTLIDLRFRGDYTPDSRKLVQEPAAKNNVKDLCTVIQDTSNWTDVPADRVRRRADFCKAAQ